MQVLAIYNYALTKILSIMFICMTLVYAHVGVRCLLGSIVYMVYSWATGRAVGEATKDVKIGTKMGINIYQWCRDMCSWKLINGPPIMLGGQGAIVQIDESVFTHQGKVIIV